jgi:hypothetical protein
MTARRSVPPWIATALAALAVAAGGCPSTPVGATCSLGIAYDGAAPGTGIQAIINPGAAECAGGVCVLPASLASTTTGPLCSVACSTDDDCANGRVTHSPADPHCKSGFSCAVVTTAGQLCCETFCVCRDFLPAGNPTPPACQPGTGSSCPNVRP